MSQFMIMTNCKTAVAGGIFKKHLFSTDTKQAFWKCQERVKLNFLIFHLSLK